MFRANNFEKLLDKATSNLRLEPDWPTILQICDLIRQNDCSPKAAVAGVKKKLESQNPHQAMFALLTLESIVKNCGSGVHDEVASKAFCEQLRDLVKNTQHENVRTKILELIQAWAFAFRNSPKYRCVQDTVNILKTEGFKFPPLKESDAMFSADTAPEWADGEVCHRCRVAFSMIVRRHHCRACGQVFCQQCSAKTSTLPKFGIEKEVRVCDACFDKVSRPPSSTAKIDIVDTSNDYGPTPAPAKKAGKTAEELQEEEELQLALALSQSEAEQKEKERRSKSYIAPAQSLHPTISPSQSSVSASPEHTNSNTTNPELSRYLDRNYWEQRRDNTTAPTAPSSQAPTTPSEEFTKPSSTNTKAPDDDAEYKEIDDFVAQLKSQIEIFVNRMKSNSSRGRSIANDTSVQTLFMNITAMHSRLLKYIQQQDDKRVYLESLQDKISQIRDSRAALDTLRAEHAARMAAAAEAAERRRQMQMAAKLEAMRKKKHEYLQYQRQLALQRVQEQERELQLRQEQQKHQYMMSSNSGYYNMPGVTGMHQYQQSYPNQPMYPGQQFPPHMMGTNEQPMSGQPQVTQAGLTHGGNIHSTIAQSMPQLPQTYVTSGPMQMSQAQINTQAAMQQPNMRQPLQQQLPLQTQMMIQQMHQMRMAGPVQTGQQMPQNIVNGQNVSQHNGQPKPNQAQIPHSMMPHMSLGQTNLAQQQASTTNPMMAMPMQNMRLPGVPVSHQLPQQMPASAYQMNMQNNPQHQMPNMQQPNMPTQMHQQGQPHMGGPQPQMMQGQMGNQAMSMQGVQMPQQGGQMPQQGGQMPQQGGQMPQQGGQMPQQGGQMQPNQGQVPQSQNPQINHNQLYQSHPMQGAPQSMPNQQQIPNQGQNMPSNQMAQGHNIPPHQMGNPGQMSQQMPSQMQGPPQMQAPGQQYPQQMQIPQAQGIPNQPIPQQQSLGQLPPGQQQPMKMPPQNFAPPPGPSQQNPPQQVKSEHNNNTAELISFD